MHDTDEDLFCELPSGMRICHRLYGPADGMPLALVAGLGLQLTFWPQSLIEGFARRGYRILVFDNRDVGRSSRSTSAPPRGLDLLLRRSPPGAYSLTDMAEDLTGLLTHVGMAAAHVVGISMGGMIAQNVAALAPQRTLSLTSIFSTTGARSVGRPALSATLKLMQPPPRSEQEAVERYVALSRFIGPKGFAFDEAAVRAQAAAAWRRGEGARSYQGVGRQIGAIMKSGDRTPLLRNVQAPTLVIHGDQDVMVHPSGGRATADAIRGAHLITIRGMGHFIAEGVVPYLLDLIDGHARRVQRDRSPELL